MKSNYKSIGPYIRIVDVRNMEDKKENLFGVSVSKVFIKSIANTVGTNFKTYRVVKKNQFTYIPDTSRRGDKIGVALLENEEEGLVSQAYTVFEITNKKRLLPEYLMMWFRRPEFDRYARYISHGSVREIFSWEDMCNVSLPIPSLEKQHEIVAEYNVIQNRINLNNHLIQKLEETTQAIYKQWFVDGIDLENLPEGWKACTVSDLSDYSNKRIPVEKLGLDNYISTENMLQNREGIVLANGLPSTGGATMFSIGNILISNIRPYFKKIWLSDFNGGCSNDVLCFVPKKNIPSLYLYQILKKNNFFEYVMAGSKGTKMPRGDKKWVLNYPAIMPNDESLDKFNKIAIVTQNNINHKKQENKKLSEMKDLLLSKIATIEDKAND
jgi:type I restriction enzyme, S subunit